MKELATNVRVLFTATFLTSSLVEIARVPRHGDGGQHAVHMSMFACLQTMTSDGEQGSMVQVLV